MTRADRKLNVINTYYSHVSRLFVSNYATFFVVYLAFIASLYNVLFRTEVAIRSLFSYASLLIMAFELLLLYRSWQFGRILNQIDELWTREMRLLDVKDVFWNLDTLSGQLNKWYRRGAFLVAVILTVCIPLLTWFLLR